MGSEPSGSGSPPSRYSPYATATPRYAPYAAVPPPAPIFLSEQEPGLSNRKSKSPPVFECGFEGCHARFARDEHLTRHERTHSQEKPFHCSLGSPPCDKWFSRLDNVRQHIKSQHSEQLLDGTADLLMKELAALQKALSQQASARRRARRHASSDSIPSVRSLRLSQSTSTLAPGPVRVPELAHPHQGSASSTSSMSPETPLTEGELSQGNAAHQRMVSAPAYLPAAPQYGYLPSNIGPSLYGAGPSNAVDYQLVAKPTWTPPPLPAQQHFAPPPLVRRGSLPSLIGLPPPPGQTPAGMSGQLLPPLPVHAQQAAMPPPPIPSYYMDDFSRQQVSPTSAFFSMALNAPSYPPEEGGQFRYDAPQPMSSMGVTQPLPSMMGKPPSPGRRPSSATLMEYVLAPPSTTAPLGSAIGGVPVPIIGPPPPGAGLDMLSRAAIDPRTPRQMIPPMGVDTGLPPHWQQGAPTASPISERQRSRLQGSETPHGSPRLSPATSSPRRFEGLAAAFGGGSSDE